MSLRLATASVAFAIGLYFGFASGPSYEQLIAMSALFHAVSVGFLIPTARSQGTMRFISAAGIGVNALFLVELAARYFFGTRVLG